MLKTPLVLILSALSLGTSFASADDATPASPDFTMICDGKIDPSSIYGNLSKFDLKVQLKKAGKTVDIGVVSGVDPESGKAVQADGLRLFQYQGTIGLTDNLESSNNFGAVIESPNRIRLRTDWYGGGGVVARAREVVADLTAGTVTETVLEAHIPILPAALNFMGTLWTNQLNVRNCVSTL